MVEEDLLGGGVGGSELEFFLEGWDLGRVDATEVVIVIVFGIRLVDFLDVCTPVLAQGSEFCIPITAPTSFLFRVVEILLTHSGMKEITLSCILLADRFSCTLLATWKPV